MGMRIFLFHFFNNCLLDTYSMPNTELTNFGWGKERGLVEMSTFYTCQDPQGQPSCYKWIEYARLTGRPWESEDEEHSTRQSSC